MSYQPSIPSVSYVRELERRPDAVVPVGCEYPGGHVSERHCHERAQLIYAVRGVMRVETPDGIWVVPPVRAIWVPPHTEHEIRTSSVVCLRALFIEDGLRPSLPRECCVIEVSPLLRELILRMAALSEAGQLNGASNHFIELILNEIREIKTLPLHIPMPNDIRAIKICRSILKNPADNRTCAQWGASVGASARTLERLFTKETGISFGAWRRQARLIAALDRLAADTPVSRIAFELGYDSASAFTVMFKRALGRPPHEFFQRPAADCATGT